MPLISRERLRRIFSTAALALAVGAAAPALASACTISSGGSAVLSQFGDRLDYVLAPGGSFEDGAPGWSLNGASIASGNEPYYVDGPGAHSLSISPGGEATTPPICVAITTPLFRFFAHQTSASSAKLTVDLLWTDGSGVPHTTTVGMMAGSASWSLSPPMLLASPMLLFEPTSTFEVREQFVAPASGGGWQIDDVNVDPYSRH